MTQKLLTTGSKLQVWNGTAKHTSGGLTKPDLMLNKKGKVVSKKQHAHGVSMGKSNLGAYLHPVGGKRATRSKKGKGIFGDIGSAVDSVGNFLGLGLPKRGARKVKRGGDAYTSTGGGDPYSSDGGRLRSSRPRITKKGGSILDTIGKLAPLALSLL